MLNKKQQLKFGYLFLLVIVAILTGFAISDLVASYVGESAAHGVGLISAVLLAGSLLLLWSRALKREELRHHSSRQRQELALEGSGTAIWDYDVNADKLLLTQQWTRLMGLEPKTMALSLAQLNQSQQIPGYAQLSAVLDEHLSQGQFQIYRDTPIVKDDGTELWVNISSKVAEYAQNQRPKVIVGSFSDISYHKGLEEDLRNSQLRLQFHLENSPLAVVEFNAQGEVTFWNRAAEKMFGFSAEQAIGQAYPFIVPKAAEQAMATMCEQVLNGEAAKTVTLLNQSAEGKVLQCQWNNTPLISQCGRINGFAAIVEDITEQRQSALRQHRSQKMEALGSLTGGIAHDYNNVLGVILGYAEILQERLVGSTDLLKYVNQIHHAGQRGAKLASNLLKFSKKEPKSQTQEDLNKLIANDREMLNQTLTVSVDLNLHLDERLWSVKIDAGGFEDMLFNLCINAKHAMSNGGKLTITTSNCEIDETLAEQLNLQPGEFVSLAVEDTGCGMNENTLSRIFDPYFSTKGSKGTGLGLSQVYGFVQASGGVIDVFSQPGLGTRFVIYFPRHHDEVRYHLKPKAELGKNAKGNETILVVDDEAPLCELVCLILQKNGYRTLSALSGEQALTLLAKESVDLMLSDVIMPKMSGFQLAEKVSRLYPHIEIRLASGFHEESKASEVHYQPTEPVLAKPYNTEELLSGIRMQLDRAADNRKTTQQKGQNALADAGLLAAEQSAIVWTDNMSIDGGGELDKDHQVLLSLLNQCREMANGERSYGELPEVIEELLNYTRYHFRREEMVMKSCHYPKYHDHCKVHNMLISKMQTIVESNNDRQIVQWLSDFLSRWLIEHIMVMDKAFVSYIEQHQPQVQEALKAFEEVVS